MVKPLLDENIRLRCNDVGGYWVELIEDDFGMFAGGKIRTWVCRIPADVVEKAAEVVKEKRGDYDDFKKPCAYFGGNYKNFDIGGRDKKYPQLGFQRLGYPEGTEKFAVCDILYGALQWDEQHPLKDSFSYETLKEFSHPSKIKSYDNYNPTESNLIYKDVVVTRRWRGAGQFSDEIEEHYHINYEGSQEKLYNRLIQNIKSALSPDDNLDVFIPTSQIFIVEKPEGGYPRPFVFKAELYPAQVNAVPRIKIFKTTDKFDKEIYKTVKEKRTPGLMTGNIPP